MSRVRLDLVTSAARRWYAIAIAGTLTVTMLTACGDRPRAVGDCVNNVPCSTDNPCHTARTLCGADGVAHCVVVHVLEDCQTPPPVTSCVPNVTCNTGNPCTDGRTVCDVDDNSICVAVRRIPDCHH